MVRRLLERTPSPPVRDPDETPSSAQLAFIRDLEKELGEVAPASALTSKRMASIWISEALERREKKKGAKKQK